MACPRGSSWLLLLGLAAAVAAQEAQEPEQLVVVRTQHTSAFQEIKGEFEQSVVGFVMFVLAFPLLWANEKRQAKMWQLFGRARSMVKDGVSSDKVDAGNEACLVHMQGVASNDKPLKDTECGVQVVNSARLARYVQMYQWVEQSKEEERDTMTGGKEKTTTYRYSTQWVSSAINSSHFQEQMGHQNPPMPIQSKNITAETLTFGAFQLTPRLVEQMKTDQALDTAELPQQLLVGGRVLPLQAGEYSSETKGAEPQVGDLRVEFRKVPCADATVLAVQHESSFVPLKYNMTVKAGRVVRPEPGSEPLLSHASTAGVLEAAEAASKDEDLEIGEKLENLDDLGFCATIRLCGSLVESHEEICALAEEKTSAQAMFLMIESQQKCRHIGLQVVGFVMLFLGLSLMLAVIPALFRIIPLVGTWVQFFGNFLVSIASMLLAVFFWCMTVAAAWLAARPVKAGVFICIACAIVYVPTYLAQQQAPHW